MTIDISSSTIFGTAVSVNTTTATATTMPANAAHGAYLDYGAGYFTGNWKYEGTLNISALSATNAAFVTGVNDQAGIAFVTTSGTDNAVVLVTAALNPTTFSMAVRDKVAGTQHNVTGVVTHAINTDYFYTLTNTTALGGQYGAIVVQSFSDSGRATFVGAALYVLTVANSSRYFYPAQSLDNGGTYTSSETNRDLTLSTFSAGIDLTTGVETDTGTGRLVVYADCIVATALNVANSETAKHVAIDEGAGFFGDYTISGVLNITAFVSTVVSKRFNILSVTDAAADAAAANDLQGISIEDQGVSTYKPYIHQAVGGTDTFSTAGPTLNLNQPYSFTLERSGTTLTLKVWNDLVLTNFAGSSQVGSTITWTGRAATTYRYLMPVASHLNGVTSRSSTFTIGGVKALGNAITATKGAFSWAGKTSAISEQPTSINATKGAFSWAGKSSPLSLMVQATKGAFNWTGKIVNLNTGGQVNTSPGAFSWAGKSSPLSHSIVTTKGAFSWSGKTTLIGATVTSLRTATLTKWDTTTQKEIPDTGLTTVLYMLYDPINLKVYDFSDNTFKASASCVTPQGTMTERVLLNSVGTNLTPGVYDILLATTGLSGLYQEYLFYYGTTNHLDSNPVRFQDGIEYLGGLTVAENTTLNAVPTAAAIATSVWSKTLPL